MAELQSITWLRSLNSRFGIVLSPSLREVVTKHVRFKMRPLRIEHNVTAIFLDKRPLVFDEEPRYTGSL
jgi:hypothetical protein